MGNKYSEDNVSKICLFGASPDTGNLGVSALCNSMVAGIATRLENAGLTVFDYGRGVRQSTYKTENINFSYNFCGLVHSRRFYRRENLWNMRVSSRFGGLGNPGVKIINNSHAILDISGGDSFTDLYGKSRFDLITIPKLFVLKQKKPLILLPQTYGPFNNPRNKRVAENILRGATVAWARDERSYERLQELLGDSFDDARHHCGVDVAFSLPVAEPFGSLSEKVSEWISPERKKETIGLNVSGLIYNDPDSALSRFGFKADYRKVVVDILERILAKTDVNILLIPHVLAHEGHYESDPGANLSIMTELGKVDGGRIEALRPIYNESEMKWFISRLNWFCGTRMHSTIAGLSTGVPTTAIAYSLKTEGVFDSCGQGKHVVDPRKLDTEDVIEALFESFGHRDQSRKDLGAHLPCVLKRANEQMDAIVSSCIRSDADA